MIQRIQSIFLFLASAAFFGLFAFPFATSTKPMKNFFSDMVYNVQDHVALLVIVGLTGLLSLVNIFLFKNRPLQIRIGYLIISLGILIPIVAALLMMNDGTPVKPSAEVNDGFGLYLPFIGIIFSILAVRFIKKDNKLVKSMDRLR